MPALVERVEALQELDRRESQRSAETFVERHCTIEEPDGSVLPFQLWPFQRETIRDLQAGENIIVLKARRLGLSWVVLAFALWLAIFKQGIRILVLCKTGDDAAELLDRIRRMRDRIADDPLSSHILAGLQKPAKSRDAVTTLDIGASTIRALMGTPAAARSETAGFLVLDEFAFQRGAGEIWRAILPTIEGGGQAALVSTGNGHALSEGIGAEFAALWSRAKQGIALLKPLFFAWMARPDRDQDWKRNTVEALGDPDRFRVEYPEVEADAFLSPDADLIYPGVHIDAAMRLGQELDDTPPGEQPYGPLYLGIDWGVNTHMILGRMLPSGGVWVFREVFSDKAADIEQDVAAIATVLREIKEYPQFIRYDPGGPGAKVVGSFGKQLAVALPGFKPHVLKIPFAKYKLVAIDYTKLLLRRTHEDKDVRIAAISPSGCPEVLRQMRKAEWADQDAAKTLKGDDHGSDALLTLTAELGYAWSISDPNMDRRAA